MFPIYVRCRPNLSPILSATPSVLLDRLEWGGADGQRWAYCERWCMTVTLHMLWARFRWSWIEGISTNLSWDSNSGGWYSVVTWREISLLQTGCCANAPPMANVWPMTRVGEGTRTIRLSPGPCSSQSVHWTADGIQTTGSQNSAESLPYLWPKLRTPVRHQVHRNSIDTKNMVKEVVSSADGSLDNIDKWADFEKNDQPWWVS